jgi:phosphohistidine phosphatase
VGERDRALQRDNPITEGPLRPPMKHLLLLRHAKSSWKHADVDDHERPLAARGQRAAKLIADHLRTGSVAPELVLCSSARRSRETLDLIAGALDEHVVVNIERDLYGASERQLLERIRAIDEDVDTALLIGHNPAIEQLALTLAGSGGRLTSLRRKYPTAALATLEFGGRWHTLGAGTARLADFVTPKELATR